MSGGGNHTQDLSLHICGIAKDGKLWHISGPVQATGPVWGSWEEVNPAGGAGPFTDVASISTRLGVGDTGKDKVLHIFGLTRSGKLLHTSRLEQQNWQPFEDLTSFVGGDWGKLLSVAGNQNNGSLDVCVIVRTERGEQRIVHIGRDTKGNWGSFEDVYGPQAAGYPGSFISADCVSLIAAFTVQLHVAGVTSNGRVWHALHFADPPWLPFIDVESMSAQGPHTAMQVSIALVEGGVHFCVRANGGLWHTLRFLNPPKWQPDFDDVKGKAGSPGAFRSADCAASGNQLCICGVTDDNRLHFTTLSSAVPFPGWQPVWQPFQEVKVSGGPEALQVISVSGDPMPWGFTGGATDPRCQQIQISIQNDALQIQAYQQRNPGDPRIASLEADIQALEAESQQLHCH